MVQQLLSAQQAAEILGLQVRTVRQYVRQGRLPGVRIGKQYRIARSDLEAFGAGAPELGDPAQPAPRQPAAEPAIPTVEAAAVVHVRNLMPEARASLERTLAAAAVAQPGEQAGPAPLRVEPLYDGTRSLMTIVIVGSAPQTAQLLQIIDAVTRS